MSRPIVNPSLASRHFPARESRARGLVVLFHGLGSSSDDMVPLAEIWQNAMPDLAFESVDAPELYDLAPPEFGGRQWFSMRESSMNQMLLGAEATSPLVHQHLDQSLADLGLTDRDLALVGFSQGAMMALHVGLRRKAQVGAIVGYSGLLLATTETPSELHFKPPILLVHGTDDPVVPFAAMAAAASLLSTCLIPVETLSCPGVGHTIDQSGIVNGASFLRQSLNG
ncbi:MAG: dienelactone hydrolase family protein [Alphaproteobacteria bacterium]|nr:dienelactone hydrolase family protein [Alphaproteobacteria bacterium]